MGTPLLVLMFLLDSLQLSQGGLGPILILVGQKKRAELFHACDGTDVRDCTPRAPTNKTLHRVQGKFQANVEKIG